MRPCLLKLLHEVQQIRCHARLVVDLVTRVLKPHDSSKGRVMQMESNATDAECVTDCCRQLRRQYLSVAEANAQRTVYKYHVCLQR